MHPRTVHRIYLENGIVNSHRICDENVMPRGRPKQFDVTKLLKLTAEQYDAIRVYAAQHGLNDSDAMRQLIARGLEAEQGTVSAEGRSKKKGRA